MLDIPENMRYNKDTKERGETPQKERRTKMTVYALFGMLGDDFEKELIGIYPTFEEAAEDAEFHEYDPNYDTYDIIEYTLGKGEWEF